MKRKISIAITSLSFASIVAISAGISTPAAAENFEQLRQLLSTKDCSGCELSNAGLRLANLARANLSGTNLSQANLDQANLSGADLSGADLSGAILFRANLDGANLRGANLSGANLSGAYLANADLTGANLNFANFNGAILANANLTSAYLDNAMLQGAISIPNGTLQPQDYYKLAYADARAGNHRGAIAKYNQSLQLDPNFAAAYLGRGVSRLQLGDDEGTKQDWQKAEELFKLQGNGQGAELSQQFIQAMEERERAGRRGGGFLGLVQSITPLLLQFLF